MIWHYLLVLASLSVFHIQAHKITFKDADLKEIANQLKALNKEIKKIIEDTAQIKECVETGENCVPPEGETADRSDKDTADDIIWVVSMYQNTGDRCYPHQLNNCVVTLDTYYDTGGTTLVSGQSTIASFCYMTAPKNGYYNICVHARFKKGGNAGDVSIALGGTTYAAAFGDAVGDDWRSTGTCTIRFLNIGSPIYAQFHSGGGDCIEETSWRYGILSAYLIVPT